MLQRPSKDLVEIFGYAPDDLTTPCRSLWGLNACPFTNTSCTKTNHDTSVVYGTCSVTTPYGDCVICPNRLYANDYQVLKTISHECFGNSIPFLMFNQFIPQRTKLTNCVVALGHNSGKEVKIGRQMSMDWVLAKIQGNKLMEYVGIEVQSIDITGNYRDAWYAYKNLKPSTKSIPPSEHGLNWANVHKRLIPQIIRKATIYSRSNLVKKGLFFVVPEIVFNKFEEILGSDMPEIPQSNICGDTISVHTYELSASVDHGSQRDLVRKRTLHISLEEFSSRFVSGPNLPSGNDLDNAVKAILNVT